MTTIIDKATFAMMVRERDIMYGADRSQQAADPRALARTVIETLRDPPAHILLAAGVPYGGAVDAALGLQVRQEAWNKMIDAILAEVAA